MQPKPVVSEPFTGCKRTGQVSWPNEFGELSITVGTCHLSSFAKEHQTRMKQLKEAFRILGSAQHAILLGDFNFGNSAPENTALPSAYRDVWQALRPNNPGYTYDTKTNTRVVQKAAPGKASQRIDRILVRSTALAPTSVELLGVAPVMYKNMPMHLSDHYGVLASLRLRRNSARSSVD